VTAVSEAADGIFTKSGEIIRDVKSYIGRAYDNAVYWVGNFFKYSVPDWIYDRVDDVKKIFDELPSFNLDGISAGLKSIHTAIQDRMKIWGFSIGETPLQQFGSLTTGYDPSGYPGAVKIIKPFINWFTKKRCGGPGQPPCEKPCPPTQPGCPGYVRPPIHEDPDTTEGEGEPPVDGGGGGKGDSKDDPTPDEIAQEQADISEVSGFEGGDYGSYNSDTGQMDDTDWDASWGDPDDFWQFGNVGGGSRRASRRASRTMRINSGPRYNNRSTRILNVNIHSSLSVADIVNDIERLESMNEASFFNGVM